MQDFMCVESMGNNPTVNVNSFVGLVGVRIAVCNLLCSRAPTVEKVVYCFMVEPCTGEARHVEQRPHTQRKISILKIKALSIMTYIPSIPLLVHPSN